MSRQTAALFAGAVLLGAAGGLLAGLRWAGQRRPPTTPDTLDWPATRPTPLRLIAGE